MERKELELKLNALVDDQGLEEILDALASIYEAKALEQSAKESIKYLQCRSKKLRKLSETI